MDFQKNLGMIHWFLQYSVVVGGWVKSDFLSQPDADLLIIRQLVPELTKFPQPHGTS